MPVSVVAADYISCCSSSSGGYSKGLARRPACVRLPRATLVRSSRTRERLAVSSLLRLQSLCSRDERVRPVARRDIALTTRRRCSRCSSSHSTPPLLSPVLSVCHTLTNSPNTTGNSSWDQQTQTPLSNASYLLSQLKSFREDRQRSSVVRRSTCISSRKRKRSQVIVAP